MKPTPIVAAACLLLAFAAASAVRAAGEDAAATTAPLRVWVVRHAAAWKNVPPAKRPHPMSDQELDALTPAGLARARAVGAELVGLGVVAVYTSPAHRAQQTAEAIAAAVGCGPPIVIDALRTLDAGTDPVAGSGMRRVRAWKAGRDPRPPGGESLADGEARAAAALGAIAREHPGQAVAVVTHGEIAASLLARAAGADPVGGYFRAFPDEGSAHEIEIEPDGTWRSLPAARSAP